MLRNGTLFANERNFPAVPRRVRCKIDAVPGGALFFCGPLNFREVFFYVHKSVQTGFRFQKNRAACVIHCAQRVGEFRSRCRYRRKQQNRVHVFGMLFCRVLHGACARLYRVSCGGCDRLSYPAFGSVLVFRCYARAVRLFVGAHHERHSYENGKGFVREGRAHIYCGVYCHHMYRQFRRQLFLYVSVLLGRGIQKRFLDLPCRQAGTAVDRLCVKRRAVYVVARSAV